MRPYLLLFIIILIAAAIRLMQLGDRALGIDEQQSVLEANGIANQMSLPLQPTFTSQNFKTEKKLSHIVRAVVERDSGNGIFHSILLSWWTSLSGNSNFSIRVVSVFFSVLTVILIFYLGRDLTGSQNAGYGSAIFFSFHHLSILYAQEARAYAMAGR